ncbi:type II toxin-antitoxin system RelE/ParE family toxin [Maricaulis maris]|jgi:toxin ParE1/3/4|uniref:type II toxin-antitoxin system RelE/ParE family toxin n=1 Tax=Maricaulis maris TaxID=74318 RepID=UPI002921B277|nr:hypothetical protein MACH15_11760 [Maricaulis maris]
MARCASYLHSLGARLRWLAEFPDAVRQRDEIAAGFRSFKHKAHVVFYRARDGGVDIFAFLHGSMDLNDFA